MLILCTVYGYGMNKTAVESFFSIEEIVMNRLFHIQTTSYTAFVCHMCAEIGLTDVVNLNRSTNKNYYFLFHRTTVTNKYYIQYTILMLLWTVAISVTIILED